MVHISHAHLPLIDEIRLRIDEMITEEIGLRGRGLAKLATSIHNSTGELELDISNASIHTGHNDLSFSSYLLLLTLKQELTKLWKYEEETAPNYQLFRMIKNKSIKKLTRSRFPSILTIQVY